MRSHIDVHINLYPLDTGWRQTLLVQPEDLPEHDLPAEIARLRESQRCYWRDLLADRTAAEITGIAELHRQPDPLGAADRLNRFHDSARPE